MATTQTDATGAILSSSQRLALVYRLYLKGQFLQAWEASKPLGPPTQWRGVDGRVMAGRLSRVLGGARQATLLHLLVLREHPADPLANYYGIRATLLKQGPWDAWNRLRAPRWEAAATNVVKADLMSMRAIILSGFRDFERARRASDAALRLAPKRAWVYVERSAVLVAEDRYREAHDAVEHALALDAWHFSAVLQKAGLLIHQDQREEARTFLEQATKHLEVAEVWLYLANLFEEGGNLKAAQTAIERAVELLPMADLETNTRLNAMRAELAYRLGDEANAIEYASKVPGGFYSSVAKRLRSATPDDRRVVLEVPYVAQHHITCAPATLTSVAKFWNRPAEHLQIAEQICYDGTPAHSERHWAEESGFVAREFTVDWPTTLALIDRGIPFTFTTIETTSAHLQAVAGYDARRGT